jgi:hypothetical protein
MKSRQLSEIEIKTLCDQDCQSDNWSLLQVRDGFDPSFIRNVRFSGSVEIGRTGSKIAIQPDNQLFSGIQNALIRECIIGDDVYISNVKILSCYIIEDNVVIENVNRILVEGRSSFGNGTVVNVLNESGGREVLIYEELSSQIAYLMTTYRHDKKFIVNLKNMIEIYADNKKSDKGVIRKNSQIVDSNKIRNVNVGQSVRISGALELNEGTIVSTKDSPVNIGMGVIARSFIILAGSSIDSAAFIYKTFVGQAVQIGKQFSSENSLIFANSECFHSEICSVFAGPFTVTHHKSTLLIAGLYSFFNAGSGTNQSNHMYKLGPIHQGIVERGCKTGSSSYLLWPSKIGAFSVVIGKHLTNFDSSDFPFSYIVATNSRTVLIPAQNFFTVGTKRDLIKWPIRDQREESGRLDLINYYLLTPYTISKIIKAISDLTDLQNSTDKRVKRISIGNTFIDRIRITKAIKDYNLIVDYYIGQTLLSNLENLQQVSPGGALSSEITASHDLNGTWMDLAGMIAPLADIKILISRVNQQKLTLLDQVQEYLSSIHANYELYNWRWCLYLVESHYKKSIKQLSKKEFEKIILTWQEAATQITRRIKQDAKKEFSDRSQIGYGIDGDAKTRKEDFETVVGTYENTEFIQYLEKEIATIDLQAKKAVEFLKSLT